jgi:ribosomal protein S16
MADTIPKWEDTEPVQSTKPVQESSIPKWEDTQPVDASYIPKWEDTAPVESMSQGEAALRGGAQGIAFDFADEGYATAQAVAAKAGGDARPFGQIYDEKVKEQRRLFEQASKEHPVTYYGTQVATGLAIPGVGWLKGGKTLGSAVKAGVAGGALAGAGASEGDLADTAISAAKGAGIGAAAGAVLHPIVKGLTGLASKKAVTEAVISEPTIASEIAKKTADRLASVSQDDIDNAVAGNNFEFVGFVLGKEKAGKALGAIDKAVSKAEQTGDVSDKLFKQVEKGEKILDEYKRIVGQYNPLRQKEMFEEFVQHKARGEEIANLNKKFLYSRGANKDPLDSIVMSWIRPASASASRADEKLGTNFSGAVLDFIEAENRLGSDSLVYNKAIESISEQLRTLRGNIGADEFNREVYKKVTTGNYEPGSVYDTIGEFFALAKNDLNKNYGLNIHQFKPGDAEAAKGVKFYLPKTMMNLEDAQIKLDRMLERLSTGAQTPELIKERKLFQDGIRYIADNYKVSVPKTDSEAKAFIEGLTDLKDTTSGVNRLEAAAAFARDSEIPPVLVERDVPKLMASYISSNMKAGLYQRGLYRIDGEIDIAKAMGQYKTAEYFEGLRDRLVGLPSSTKANVQRRASEWRFRGDRLLREGEATGSSYLTALGAIQKTVPDMLPWVMSNMYTNLLALNPYAIVRNVTQPYALGTPDIAKHTGLTYASRNMGKALIKTVKGLTNLKDLKEYNRRVGIHKEGPPENITLKSIVNGLREANVPEPIVQAFKGYEHLAKLAMSLYSGADEINRYTTAHMAEFLVKDMYSSNANIKNKAFKYLEDMPPALAQKVSRAYDAGDEQTVLNTVRNHMVLRHQYSYTTADLNRVGREFGGIATAFTKFPVSVISDIEHELYKGGMAGLYPLTVKYLAPYAMLATADHVMQEVDAKDSPIYKLFLGEKFTDLAPALGIKLSPPPILSIPYKVADTVIKSASELGQQDAAEIPEFAAKTAGKMVKSASPLLPYYGLYDYTNRRLQRAGLLEKDEE